MLFADFRAFHWLVSILVIYIIHAILVLFASLCVCYSVTCDASVQCAKTESFPTVL